MKNLWLLLMLFPVFPHCTRAQEKYDMVQYAAPGGWKKEDQNFVRIYSRIDGGSWAQIAIYKSTASKGSIESDMQSEWENIVLSQHTVQDEEKTAPQQVDGWTIASRSGTWQYNGATVATILTTYSNNKRCVSILCNVTAQPYFSNYQDLLGSIKLDIEGGNVQNPVSQNPIATTAISDRFKFNTTNFDDGWVSTIQADWVEVSKGAVKVLLHYPKEGTVFPADPAPLTNAAWNILVAPRYSSLANYRTAYISDYIRQYYGMGTLIDNNTQQPVFVLLFRREGGWIECIASDKNTFIQEFKFDPETVDHNTEPAVSGLVAKMAGYNRFAVAAEDINNTGQWSDHFSSNTFYSNYYTGAYEGMSTYTSSQSFEFSHNQSYTWELVAANSAGGRTSFAKATGKGNFKLINEWKIRFSEMEGKPKTYDAYFSAIRGGRVLWLNDAEYPGSGIFTGFTPSGKR
ncbi:MAG: hypothetical protein QM781_09130 [Chitinophagaceae bacterium]